MSIITGIPAAASQSAAVNQSAAASQSAAVRRLTIPAFNRVKPLSRNPISARGSILIPSPTALAAIYRKKTATAKAKRTAPNLFCTVLQIFKAKTFC